MERGVLALFGETSMFTTDSIKSFVNHYNIPFYTWSYPNLNTETTTPNDEYLTDVNSDDQSFESESQTTNTKQINKNKRISQSSYLFNMHPTLTPLLVSLLKYYRWPNIYYIYDNDEALNRIQAMFDYQIRDKDFVTNIYSIKLFVLLIVVFLLLAYNI